MSASFMILCYGGWQSENWHAYVDISMLRFSLIVDKPNCQWEAGKVCQLLFLLSNVNSS